jgi:RHH-type transcriptional regulator, proline utilization regulon repressor / proline dehydrogenase / delta 1-pyrroline-5-carboxylate dehydrogenase
VIVLDKVYQQFVDRLVAAAECLKIGPAEDSGSYSGPVIDEEAFQRIQEYIEIGKEEADLRLAGTHRRGIRPGLVDRTAHLRRCGEPDARIAQEEIFGPVLAVIRADDLGRRLRDRQRNALRTDRGNLTVGRLET